MSLIIDGKEVIFTKVSKVGGDYTATNGVDTIKIYRTWRRVGGYQWAANVKNGVEDVVADSRKGVAKHAFRLLAQRAADSRLSVEGEQ